MQRALLTSVLIASLALAHPAGAAFRCFDTPGHGPRCACIGPGDCDAMLKSGNCRSDPECDKGELGAKICSCKAKRTAKIAP